MPLSDRTKSSVKAPTTDARITARTERNAMSQVEPEKAKEPDQLPSPPDSDTQMDENENQDGEGQYGNGEASNFRPTNWEGGQYSSKS